MCQVIYIFFNYKKPELHDYLHSVNAQRKCSKNSLAQNVFPVSCEARVLLWLCDPIDPLSLQSLAPAPLPGFFTSPPFSSHSNQHRTLRAWWKGSKFMCHHRASNASPHCWCNAESSLSTAPFLSFLHWNTGVQCGRGITWSNTAGQSLSVWQ